MPTKKITRRNFINKSTTGIVGAAVAPALPLSTLSISAASCTRSDSGYLGKDKLTGESFAREVEKVLPEEAPYTYHKKLSEDPVHKPGRDFKAVPLGDEISLSDTGWKLIWIKESSALLNNAVLDFQDYMQKAMGVMIETEDRDKLDGWQNFNRCIVAGTMDQLSGSGMALKGSKDYEIKIASELVTVCGYDDKGVMYGLYNLEARMNLREAPFLPANLNTVRHSLYDVRMVHSWMGWMEWPDTLLSHLSHDGFDAIFASALANPNNDRTTAESSTDFYARILFRIREQKPDKIHDLIKRATKFGISVYTPIIYQYTGTEESEAGLRKLVKDIIKEFPEIKGYVLLTEGFWYKKWGGGHGATKDYIEDWARNWCRAVGIVTEECHRVNPDIEILPWEYNIDFRPQNVETKRYFIRQLPDNTIPLLTWENGKSFEIDGLKGYLRDYAISQIGPAEVTQAQIGEARKRGMKVYTNADTFVCGGQFQTVPYNPFPYQWHERYKALEKYGVNGTLESWTSGYSPSFMTAFRAWHCWSDSPPIEELLGAIASSSFGNSSKDKVLKAWDLFSQAIRLVPDTGPTMGTSSAIGNPLFFREPQARTATFNYSWEDFNKWKGYFGGGLNPFWPYTLSRLTFYPDFTNRVNNAENYARNSSGIAAGKEIEVLPVFLKYLHQADEKMEEGLKLYRDAALKCPESKRQPAYREVLIAEQIQRMIQSEHAILEFEDLRFKQAEEKDITTSEKSLERMKIIVKEEISRTELSLIAAERDSRLGFQQECDYVYTPYSLKEKLKVLSDTLENQLSSAHKSK
jgi:hypothetical protein